jgi:PIN domain nuclease of toxin-antitoxin system
MKLLLDTHIWIWSLLDPPRLTRRVAKALEKKDSELWLSPISIWEFLILVEKGRISLDSDVEEWLERAFQAAPLREAPLTYQVALETNKLRLQHRDPADSFLVATARVFGLTLVTADDRLIRARAVSTLANR